MSIRNILFVLLAAALFLSCGQKQESKSTKTIGVSLLTRAHVFYKDLEEGLKSEAAKNGYELIITAGEFDIGKQSSQIEDFITRKVDAIVLCPVDSRGVGPAVRKANEAKIPVFTADIAAQEGDVVCHIASDNVAGGRLAGEYLAKLLGGKGNLAIIGQPTVTSVLDRVQGFKDAVAKFPDMKIVADMNGEGVRDKAMQVASDVLQSHPDLQGIFGINDDSALGTLDAVQQFKRDNVAVIGYDAIPAARDAIMKGTALKADVIQYPTKIGETTIQKVKEYFSGAQLPKVVPVEVGIVDKAALQSSGMH
ncbi:MAG TPA: substrate-binding domain-containing protein [Bacteroidota bacterium]|jgi:ribose transport system substrate-binding protein|nr:substrate-binding domain-containing protein [Bacteroidota bacterium]